MRNKIDKRTEQSKKNQRHWEGKKFSDKHRENLVKARLASYKEGRVKNVGGNMKIVYDNIDKEIPELEKQGFHCIPIGRIVPDMIAIKDGKVYAVEVEYGKPNYEKYNKNNYRDKFDDIIWILRRKK